MEPRHITVTDESEDVIGELALGIDLGTGRSVASLYFGDELLIEAHPEGE